MSTLDEITHAMLFFIAAYMVAMLLIDAIHRINEWLAGRERPEPAWNRKPEPAEAREYKVGDKVWVAATIVADIGEDPCRLRYEFNSECFFMGWADADSLRPRD